MDDGGEEREEQGGGRNIICCTAGCLPWDAANLSLVCLRIHCEQGGRGGRKRAREEEREGSEIQFADKMESRHRCQW